MTIWEPTGVEIWHLSPVVRDSTGAVATRPAEQVGAWQRNLDGVLNGAQS